MLHRGSEKLIESLNGISCGVSGGGVDGCIPYFDRLDYVSNMTQEQLYIVTIERLMSVHTGWIVCVYRGLFCELYRILNHVLNITTYAIDMGLFTTML